MSLFCNPIGRPSPLSVGFPRQEYWSGLPFPSPGDLPNPGMQPASPALSGRFFITEPSGKPPKFQLKASKNKERKSRILSGDSSRTIYTGDFPGGSVVKSPLPTQETWIQSLSREDPTCHGATEPLCCSDWTRALEPRNHNYWARYWTSSTLEPVLCNKRNYHEEKPVNLD